LIRALGLLLALALLPQNLAAQQADAEITWLLSFVSNSGCEFYRNGSAHDSVSAAEHLGYKYQRGKRWVSGADQFIERIASGSSLSGSPYEVECDGNRMTSRDWLMGALAAHRASAVRE